MYKGQRRMPKDIRSWWNNVRRWLLSGEYLSRSYIVVTDKNRTTKRAVAKYRQMRKLEDQLRGLKKELRGILGNGVDMSAYMHQIGAT